MGSQSRLTFFSPVVGLHCRTGYSRRAVWLGVCAGLAAAVVLLITSAWTPMVWDEGDAILRAERIREWFGNLFREEAKGPPALSPEGLSRGWPFTTQREGHPALYGIVIALGRSLAPGFLDPLTRYRFGPILLFSVAIGAVVYRLAGMAGPVTAAAAFLCIFLQPRLFAHAHFASFDGPVTAWWMLAWACCPFFEHRNSSAIEGCSRIRSTILWGVILGATMSTKATGWFAIVPFVVWAIVRRKREVVLRVMAAIIIALVAFFLFNPPLWCDPLHGWLRFFQLNLGRHQTPGLNITTFFLGKRYNLDYPLPWYNTLFWTGIAVPIPILMFFAVGLIYWIRSPRRGMLTLIVLHWLVLVVVRALPGTPPHDGIRLFLPVYPFLGILAGHGFRVGTTALVVQFRRWQARFTVMPISHGNLARSRKGGRVNVGALPARVSCMFRVGVMATAWVLILSPIFSLVCFCPQWLSYYNKFIGGLSGAAAAGMEPTYYWDGLDREVFLWLEIHSLETEKVYYSACSWTNLRLLQDWGWLKRAFATSPGDAQWYVVQNRPGAWFPEDQWLFMHGEAAFVKYPGRGGVCSCVGRVPVVKIFPIREYFRACRAVYNDAVDGVFSPPAYAGGSGASPVSVCLEFTQKVSGGEDRRGRSCACPRQRGDRERVNHKRGN
ncbi:MAG: ArnT family glycosyltransferase [Thermogutta sp.]